MEAKRWQEIKRIYEAAAELAPESRDGFLDERCAGDESLRQQVESFLECRSAAEDFLKSPAFKMTAPVPVGLDESRTDLTGSTLLHYSVTRKIGAGGMGEVYEARDLKLNRQVALKILPDSLAHDPERLARFDREAKLLASLNHPYIAAIYGLEDAGGKRFLVLELVEGETLAQRISRGPLPMDEVLEICLLIAEGLEAAHEKGIIHRDLKPANIQITPGGKVKILDFGLARGFHDLHSREDQTRSPTITATMTQPGVVLGTAAYLSPEQAKGMPVDKRLDIWGFGCVLFECLTGKRAFQGETISETVAAILKSEPDWTLLPAGAPAMVQSLLQRCLQKDPRERTHDIADARIEIAEAIGHPLVAGALPAAMPRRRWILIAVAAIAAALFFVTGVFVERSMRGSQPALIMRSLIPLPAGTQLTREIQGPTRTEIALSPDGSYLVFSASSDGSESKSLLYRRAMDRTDASAIRGTEGARMPFFSPDGTWIGFWAQHKLRKVPSGGGILTDLCDLPALPTGASWGTDGWIIFGTSIQGLQRIPDEGGKPELITKIDSTKETSHRLPCVLPGGKALVFTAMPYGLGAMARVELLMLQTGERKILIEDGADARYVSTGDLLFVRRGTLMAVRFDPDRLQTTGPAAPVLEGVMQALNSGGRERNSAAGQYAFSESGSLVYASGGIFPDPEVQWYWIDRKGKVEPMEFFSKKPIGQLRISPDGKRIAYVTVGMNSNLWVYDITRGTSTILTRDGRALYPIWTPDSGRMAFAWTRAGLVNIWSQATDGRNLEQFTHSDFRQYPGSWTRDGKFLAYVEDNPLTGPYILVYAVDSKQVKRFPATQSSESAPEFSPDGSWLAYVSKESGKDEVYVRSFPAGDKVVLISNQGGEEPIWAPDGHELFYWNPDFTKLMKVDVVRGQELSPGTMRVLFEFAAAPSSPIRGYDITPDGTRFLVRARPRIKPTEVTQLNLVLNWFEELKRLAPAGKK